MAELVAAAGSDTGQAATVGVGIPGVISPATQRVKNANTQVLIGQALDRDLKPPSASPSESRTTPTASR